MVGKRNIGQISKEFEGGILPGITNGGAAPAVAVPIKQLDRETAKQPDRKKVTLYLDDPRHTDLMDDLLTALKRHGLPRDNSMLVRALLEQATSALENPEALDNLIDACRRTLPNR